MVCRLVIVAPTELVDDDTHALHARTHPHTGGRCVS